MTPLRFCFVLHIHQPVGNFDHVFRDHADDVYMPFLDFLEARQLWPIGLHVSGPLLEWLEENRHPLHDRIGRLATDGHLELLSAGWYEPILAALPRADRAEQLEWMQAELRARFGVTPTGLWLTERVWEPDLPSDLAQAGLEYALVDDHLALRAGVPASDMARPLRTEAGGHYLDLLAIDERLRYLIPFRPADEIADELRTRHERGEALALIGDDGEKFGGWPRTREWLYDQGWLEAFGERMDALRAEGVVRWVTPADARSEIPATGPVYLPSGSYPEMEGWALGGHWKGFLSRYPEANRIHKRMMALSDMSRKRGDPAEVRRALGRAQCNDAYWHGVFGGLYMKHLREGVRRELMGAERLLRAGEALGCSRLDVDGDGGAEWWAHGAAVSAWIDSQGRVTDLLWLEADIDVLDVLTRYRERYHEEALRRDSPSDTPVDDDAAPSIHDIEEAATLDRLPPEDGATRVLVRERVLSAGQEFQSYVEADFEPVWSGEDFTVVEGPTEEEDDQGGLLWRFRTGVAPIVEKTVTLHADGSLTYEWRWTAGDFPSGTHFAPEVSLGAAVAMNVLPEADVWRYPIITTSKCPDGFEEIEQGWSHTPRWPIERGWARVELRPPQKEADPATNR